MKLTASVEFEVPFLLSLRDAVVESALGVHTSEGQGAVRLFAMNLASKLDALIADCKAQASAGLESGLNSRTSAQDDGVNPDVDA